MELHFQRNFRPNCYLFNSNYIQGNLYQVYQTDISEFTLLLSPDTNFVSQNQWFNFQFQSLQKNEQDLGFVFKHLYFAGNNDTLNIPIYLRRF